MTITQAEFFNHIKLSPLEIIEDSATLSKGTKYYMEIFEKHKNDSFFLSWNWAAFFLGLPWMFYRKLYLLAFTTILVLDVLIFVLYLIVYYNYSLFLLMGFEFLILLPLFFISTCANSLYINHIKSLQKKIRPIREPISLLAGIFCFIGLPIIGMIPITLGAGILGCIKMMLK
ncbi:MAG: hypothetical protein B7Y25_03175 [Alphaproteobacteria bacterium 16-39-46]|nr:MAG: hypothetical protein B7Y25_03175 [Alphaproteobacteria bacterium 16-39-46]OZA43799.1 MAG: hypothetical protein B7X84_02110 [Alphaproteobacteria bacterium 17-39-52]HQS83709.1 DUF2628 domain-containing protein [Alphaproteobacteria bacterium]HQS93488.1 DUF2628 domain-containing protein [Alphaproteobacteria bacterium]